MSRIMRRPILTGFLCASAMCVGLLFVAPVLWITLSSFKTTLDIFAMPPKFVFSPTLQNYHQALSTAFAGNMLNSFIIALASTFFSVGIGSLAAYAFSRVPLRGKDNLLFWILSLRFLPIVAATIPLFLVFRALGINNTHLALILCYGIFNVSFSVWVLKGFFDEVPIELEEAAAMDGYSRFEVFYRFSLPLVRSGIVVAAIFCMIQSLNEFLMAISINTEGVQTAPISLAQLMDVGGTLASSWGIVGAGGVMFVVPIVVFTIMVRNHLIRGMSFGRMK